MATEGQMAAGALPFSEEPSSATVVNSHPRPEAMVVLGAVLTMISVYFPHEVGIAIEGRQTSVIGRTAHGPTDYAAVGSWVFIARLVLAAAGVVLGVWGRNRSGAIGWRIVAEATIGVAAVVSAGMVWILVTN